MSETLPPASRMHDVRRIAHALYATGQNNIRFATGNGLGSRNDRLKRRAAGTIDRKTWRLFWDSCSEGCVAGKILLDRSEAAAEYDFVDLLGLSLGAGYNL